MRRIMTLTLLAALAVMLAACSATATSSTDATGSQTAAAAGTPIPNNVSLPVLTQLVIGTFKLEDTELAITPDQATTLLPLWLAVRSLSASDTAASEEMAALEQQIQDTMTTEQTDQINAMQLTRADLQTLAGELGATFGNDNQASTTGTPGAQAFPDGGVPPDGGALPDGGIPLDGGALPSGSLTTEQQATREASGASQPNVSVPSAFVDALIQLLEAKAQ